MQHGWRQGRCASSRRQTRCAPRTISGPCRSWRRQPPTAACSSCGTATA